MLSSILYFSTNNVEFPTATVCPDYNIAYKSDILMAYNTTASDLRNSNYPKLSDLSSYELHNLATHELLDLLVELEVSTLHSFEQNGSKYYNLVYGFQKEAIKDTSYVPIDQNDWKEKRYQIVGRCFSFVPPKVLVESQIRTLDFTFKKDVDVYFHHDGQFFSVDGYTKIQAILGEQIFIDAMHEVLIDYEKKMTDEEMIREKSEFEFRCDHEMNVGFDECIINGLDKRAMDSIGCTFPTLTNQKELSCDAKFINESQANLLKEQKIFRAQTSIKDCPLPCSTMNVFLGFPKYNKVYSSEKARAKIYFKRRVTEKKNVVPYDWVSFLAEIGGYMGLLLGWSMLDLTLVFKTITNSFKHN